MEGWIFQQLYTRVRELGKTYCFKGKRFSDAAIVMSYLCAVLNNAKGCLLAYCT